MTKNDVDVLVDHLTTRMNPHKKRLILTIAPEQVDPLLLDRLIVAGVIVFAGHSNASTEQMIGATDQGVSGITHLFNACSQITARAPGIVGTALTDPRLSAGIIADGFHVAPRLLKLAAQVMADRLCLVSDTMPTFASDLTGFRIGDNKISLVDGRLQAEDGTLAGAHLGLDQAVANMCTLAGVSLADALNMASGVPAKILGMTDLYGQIDVGRPASLTCLAENLTCLDVFVHGKQQRKN
jgi:N-acetylglucosamine-6-phosphate deacetylase